MNFFLIEHGILTHHYINLQLIFITLSMLANYILAKYMNQVIFHY